MSEIYLFKEQRENDLRINPLQKYFASAYLAIFYCLIIHDKSLQEVFYYACMYFLEFIFPHLLTLVITAFLSSPSLKIKIKNWLILLGCLSIYFFLIFVIMILTATVFIYSTFIGINPESGLLIFYLAMSIAFFVLSTVFLQKFYVKVHELSLIEKSR